MTARELICRPFTVYGRAVTARQIASAIDRLADLPLRFISSDLSPAILPGATYHEQQEALNRLLQRWRKLGLIEFGREGWALRCGAWDQMQASAIEARQRQDRKDGPDPEGESATRQGDAQ